MPHDHDDPSFVRLSFDVVLYGRAQASTIYRFLILRKNYVIRYFLSDYEKITNYYKSKHAYPVTDIIWHAMARKLSSSRAFSSHRRDRWWQPHRTDQRGANQPILANFSLGSWRKISEPGVEVGLSIKCVQSHRLIANYLYDNFVHHLERIVVTQMQQIGQKVQCRSVRRCKAIDY